MSLTTIIFLDIDGVLWPYDSNFPKDEYGFLFKKECVEALQYLLSESEADLVISSSWKMMGLRLLKEMWEVRKLPGNIISITPDSHQELLEIAEEPDPYHLSRGYEIERWLRNHPVSTYLIIDDLPDFSKEQEKHLIIPKANEG